MERMEALEDALEALDPVWDNASRKATRLKGYVEKRRAQLRVAKIGAKGNNDDKKAEVEDEMWLEEHEGERLMEAFVLAEAGEKGCQARFKTLDRRLSSLQSRLQALVRMESIPQRQHH